MNIAVNPLARGFYSVKDAARLIENARARRIYGWLKGYPDRDIGPLLERDYTPINDRQELSFLDLIEVRFLLNTSAHTRLSYVHFGGPLKDEAGVQDAAPLRN